jgi:hypothetical protein
MAVDPALPFAAEKAAGGHGGRQHECERRIDSGQPPALDSVGAGAAPSTYWAFPPSQLRASRGLMTGSWPLIGNQSTCGMQQSWVQNSPIKQSSLVSQGV